MSTLPYSRTRYSNMTVLNPGSRTILSGPGCTFTTSATNGYRSGVYRCMSDYVVPGYKARSARGEIFNNPMSRLKQTFTGSPSGYSHAHKTEVCETANGSVRDSFTNLLGWKLGPLTLYTELSGPTPVISDASLISAAAAMALANIKSPSVQGLVFLGELRQTIQALTRPLNGINQALSRRTSRKKRYAGAIGNQYLWFSFGILPLMHDIEGIWNALLKVAHERETARGFATDTTTIVTPNILLHSGSALVDSRYQQTYKETVTVRAGSLYQFSGRTLADSLGFSLRDIPAAMWEMLPWSFVVDWFSNLGDLVAGMTAHIGNDILAEWYTVTRVQEVTRLVTSTTTSSAWRVVKPCSDTDKAVYESYFRVPTNLTAHSALVFNPTFSRVPALSAIALIMQQFSKGK